jgi:hypothetical protein
MYKKRMDNGQQQARRAAQQPPAIPPDLAKLSAWCFAGSLAYPIKRVSAEKAKCRTAATV